MKKLLMIPLLLIISLSDSYSIDLKKLQLGISMGYTPGINDVFIHDNSSCHDYCPARDYVDETFHGIYFGATIRYNLYEGEKTSHNLIIRPVYESYSSDKQKVNPQMVILNGETFQANFYRDLELNLSYINLDLLYSFDFANKHIGIFTGVSFAYILDHDYFLTEERANAYGNVFVGAGAQAGDLDDTEKFSPTFVFGFEFPFDYWKIHIIPNALLRYPHRIINRELEWDFMSYRLGVDLMFYLK